MENNRIRACGDELYHRIAPETAYYNIGMHTLSRGKQLPRKQEKNGGGSYARGDERGVTPERRRAKAKTCSIVYIYRVYVYCTYNMRVRKNRKGGKATAGRHDVKTIVSETPRARSCARNRQSRKFGLQTRAQK